MLLDRYEPDPKFWAIIKLLAIQMEPELAQIDKILDDDELFQLIKGDLAQRHPHTLETGRNSTPVEAGCLFMSAGYYEARGRSNNSCATAAYPGCVLNPVPP